MNSGVEDTDNSTEEQPPTLMQKLRAMNYSASKTFLRRTKSSPPAPLFRRKAGSQGNIKVLAMENHSNDALEPEVPQQLPPSDSERSSSISTDCSGTPDVCRRPSEIAGGIALSEIAVEEHVPDIITQLKSPL
jgi:hypothetical protein